jgi:cytochrome b involved in lipid metabolism
MLVLTITSAGLLGGALHARRPARALRAHVRAIATSPEAEEAPPQQQQKDRLNIRIDDEWYDLTNWRMAHPAGAHWIDAYKNQDATEVMYGFHSDKAMA